MFRVTEPVTVFRTLDTGLKDAMNEPVLKSVEETVQALVAPKGTEDLTSSNRDGSKESLRLYFAKGYNKAMRGMTVRVRGADYRVVGDPSWYDPSLTPTEFNYVVEVERVDG